ncbi:MAG: hypothetical protein K2Y21_10825 [Phycisphaerales bacterium]|nr:hypothetical protein [Phycisphaerales bacterium]
MPDRPAATLATFLGVSLMSASALAVPYVLVPDNTNYLIVGFTQATGAPISIEGKTPAVWLDVSTFVDTSSIGVLRHAAQVGSEIWISDQMSGIIHRVSAQYDTPRYLGFIDTIPNARGIGIVNGEAWVASGGIGTAGGIARFNTSAQPLGIFDAEDPFDVYAFGAFVLTANIAQNRLEIFQTNGTLTGPWGGLSTLDFPLQIVQRTSGPIDEIIVVGNSLPDPGLFRYSVATSNFLGRILTQAFLPFITVTQPRGVAVLGTGELLWSSTQGVFAVNPTNNLSRTLYTGDNFVCNMADTVDFAKYCEGDINNDSFVDDSDFTLFASAYNDLLCPTLTNGFPAGCPADLNGDGFVDDSDFSTFARGYDRLLCP